MYTLLAELVVYWCGWLKVLAVSGTGHLTDVDAVLDFLTIVLAVVRKELAIHRELASYSRRGWLLHSIIQSYSRVSFTVVMLLIPISVFIPILL